MLEIVEDRLIEQFIAHAAIERLTNPVLHRLSRRDEMPRDAGALRPGEHGVGGEFGSVIGDDEVWFAAPSEHGVELPCDASAGDRGIRDGGQTFLGDVIEDVENADTAPVRELVMDEIN